MTSGLTAPAQPAIFRRASDHAFDESNRVDRGENTPIVGQGSQLDVQMGASSANAIRAGPAGFSPAQQAGYKTAALPPASAHEELTCDPGGAQVRAD